MIVNATYWLIASPVLFVLPGLLPARLVTGAKITAWTIVWAVFFSVLFVPLISFALAMIIGTTAGPFVFVPVAMVLGLAGLIYPKRTRKEPRQ